MIFDTKSVKDLRSQQADLKVMVAMAKKDEQVEISKLRDTMTHARSGKAYELSTLASSLRWKNHD